MRKWTMRKRMRERRMGRSKSRKVKGRQRESWRRGNIFARMETAWRWVIDCNKSLKEEKRFRA